MVFGDNVRARMGARALPRTPQPEEEEEEEEEAFSHPSQRAPPFRPTQTITAIPQ